MAQKQSNPSDNSPAQFVFGKQNYQLLIISIVVVITGFTLMSGDTDIYNFTKIILAPIVVLIGFALGFYAILKKSSAKV
ncbi:DUF3098 domain-containing protein [Pedobacter cryophilus]|uniref:DUF3098 domain-containing protein n=1 Tax=Pedobacter cryophilus TaxID=2571271 RepID=A0A4U1C2N2_9SPHI|nr:DUF3098 domain-containing protein [Pedobacter cryophilus]TKB98556.1 DUF3098 domain-containing protein [Pedobacter cryophilus]